MAEKKTVAEKVQRRKRIQRDSAILLFACALAAYEVVLGGARASVLTFVAGIFISPVVLRVDESRKNGNGGG